MLRDITLGQYYQTDSVIHKLDPRVKLVATLCFIVSLFVVKSWVCYAAAAVFLVVMIRLSHVPFRYMVKGMKATGERVEAADHKGRAAAGRHDGGALIFPDRGIVGDDADDHTQQSDRRYGKAAETA